MTFFLKQTFSVTELQQAVFCLVFKMVLQRRVSEHVLEMSLPDCISGNVSRNISILVSSEQHD